MALGVGAGKYTDLNAVGCTSAIRPSMDTSVAVLQKYFVTSIALYGGRIVFLAMRVISVLGYITPDTVFYRTKLPVKLYFVEWFVCL